MMSALGFWGAQSVVALAAATLALLPPMGKEVDHRWVTG